MSQTLLRILSATMIATALGPLLGTACTGSGKPADKAAQTSASGTAATTVASTAPGTLGAQIPHDTINDRADAGRILGDPKATVWVVMVSDFQCPYCKEWHDAAFQKLVKTYVNTGRIRMAFLNMPLSIHQNAVPAAEAAMCSSIQNKFWQMQEALFATQKKWEVLPDPVPTLDTLAVANGVDEAPWRICMAKHLTLPLIQADHDRATQYGAGSTPTFFVDGQHFAGADANLVPAIDAAIAKAGKKPAS
jgi:protein-disulfide isomerase